MSQNNFIRAIIKYAEKYKGASISEMESLEIIRAYNALTPSYSPAESARRAVQQVISRLVLGEGHRKSAQLDALSLANQELERAALVLQQAMIQQGQTSAQPKKP